MTVKELKVEAAKLPPEERRELSSWLDAAEDVQTIRRQELIQEIELGVGQLERGEQIECHNESELHQLIERVKGAGRARLSKATQA